MTLREMGTFLRKPYPSGVFAENEPHRQGEAIKRGKAKGTGSIRKRIEPVPYYRLVPNRKKARSSFRGARREKWGKMGTFWEKKERS